MTLPVNFQRLDPSAIESAVEHALFVVRQQIAQLQRLGLDTQGLNVLELGPGSDFGPALILASQGARMTVADRFLAEWQDDYHCELYRRLASAWPGRVDQLLAVVEGGYEASSLVRVAEPAENLASIPDGSIDFAYSGAVLEHVVDFGAVAAELDRVTKVGGHGAHVIDLRYHNDFARPLEHLLLLEQEFLCAAEDCNYEFGNRYRSSEFAAHFAKAGFAIVHEDVMEAAQEAYLEGFLPRLAMSKSSYRNWPAADLKAVVIRLLVEKSREPEGAALRTRGGVMLELIERMKAQTRALFAQEPAPEMGPYLEIELRAAALGGPDGRLWVFSRDDLPEGDSGADPRGSAAVLLEDGQPLGPAHSLHDGIREQGVGRYSHWGKSIYFSTSDGSSPLENGRRYAVRFPLSAYPMLAHRAAEATGAGDGAPAAAEPVQPAERAATVEGRSGIWRRLKRAIDP